MTRYKIFTSWRRVGMTGLLEDTGMIVEAASIDEAREIAARQGASADLGRRVDYLGLAAIPMECLP